MAKTIQVPPAPVQLYQHPDGFTRTYPPGRVIEVGTLAGLNAAIAGAQNADTIEIVWPGVYLLSDTLVQAVPNLYIKGGSGVAADIILRGKGMDNASYGNCPHGIYSQVPGLRVSDLTLENFFHHGITFGAGASDPEFTNVEIRDCGQQFIKASAFPAAINNGRVTGCRMGYTAGRPVTNHPGVGFFYGSPIDVHNGANWIVFGNIFTEIAPTAAEIAAATAADGAAYQNWWAPAVYFWNRSSNNIVDSNIFVNCGRAVAFGLVYRNDGTFDNSGGIIRNNMCTVTPGRFGQAQIDDSDGQIIAWDSPSTKILHNTVITNAQCADAIQGRWSQNLQIASNLLDNSIGTRNAATFSGVNNIQNVALNNFVDPSTGNLHLNSTGLSNVPTAPRLSDVLYDLDGATRGTNTKIGADVNG